MPDRGERAPVQRAGGLAQKMLGSMAMMVCCLFLIVIGGVRLVRWVGTSLSTRHTTEELQALYQTGVEERSTITPVVTYTPATSAELPATMPTAQAAAMVTVAPTVPATPRATATLCPPYLLEYQQITEKVLPELVELRRINKDLIGWLSIDGVLALPVVYRNNTYYMDHDFYGTQSAAGTVFLDENHPLTRRAQHLLLYGHNMRDGSMFGHLTHYLDESYYQKNCMIDWATLYNREEYIVFAVMQVSTDPKDGHYFNFAGHPSFRSVEEFDAYLAEIACHNLYPNALEVNAEDALLTLSTCYGEDRLVLVARRLRSGESEAYVRQQVRR